MSDIIDAPLQYPVRSIALQSNEIHSDHIYMYAHIRNRVTQTRRYDSGWWSGDSGVTLG